MLEMMKWKTTFGRRKSYTRVLVMMDGVGSLIILCKSAQSAIARIRRKSVGEDE
jgi:hypothetical protein